MKSEKLFVDGRTDVPTDGHFRPPLMLLGQLGGVDLNIEKCYRRNFLKEVSIKYRQYFFGLKFR